MNNSQKAAQQTQMENAAREQVIINTRILALKHAQKLANLRSGQPGDTTTAEQLLKDADEIQKYLLGNIESVKPKSGLVVTSVMPPPAAGFKPGD